MSFEIRPAVESDILQILTMLREFAEFLQLSNHCEVTEESLQFALFGEHSVAEAIVVIEDNSLVGYAIFFPYFASFRGQRGIYLEDIYLKPEMRGKNIGENMLRYLAKLAKSRGFERIDFQVLRSNSKAIKFYKNLGAVLDETEQHLKFTDQAFQNLAS